MHPPTNHLKKMPNSSITITVIGSLNKDLITRTSRIPSAGETLIASSFEMGSGGKGANQAVACARLASRWNPGRRRQDQQHDEDPPENEISQESPTIRVRMIGAVGADSFGHDLMLGLLTNGVDISGVRTLRDQQTGVAIVLVDDGSGENRILVSPNANYMLQSADFETMFVPLPGLILLQLEIPLKTVEEIIEMAKRAGVDVLLNPAPAPAAGALRKEIYAGLTHLVMNESEAANLWRGLQAEDKVGAGTPETSQKEKDEQQRQAPGPAEIAQAFLNRGVENVVITLGAQGAYYASTFSTTGLEPVPPVPAGFKVVDTTGAGDTFVGAYAVKICEEKLRIGGSRSSAARSGSGSSSVGGAGDGGNGVRDDEGEGGRGGAEKRTSNKHVIDIQAAVQFANLAASKSVLKKGAQDGMPWREEMDG